MDEGAEFVDVEDEEEDPDSKMDPLYSVDLKKYLFNFLRSVIFYFFIFYFLFFIFYFADKKKKRIVLSIDIIIGYGNYKYVFREV